MYSSSRPVMNARLKGICSSIAIRARSEVRELPALLREGLRARCGIDLALLRVLHDERGCADHTVGSDGDAVADRRVEAYEARLADRAIPGDHGLRRDDTGVEAGRDVYHH